MHLRQAASIKSFWSIFFNAQHLSFFCLAGARGNVPKHFYFLLILVMILGGKGKRDGRVGGLANKQTWNIHLNLYFFLVGLLLYDTGDCVWTQFLSQMLLKALLPAPGAEYNSYLKNAYKKKKKKVNCFFPSLEKSKKWQQQKEKELKKQTTSSEWSNENKKERSQSRGLVIKPSHSGAFPLFMLLMIKITWDGLGQVCGLRM